MMIDEYLRSILRDPLQPRQARLLAYRTLVTFHELSLLLIGT